MNKMYLIIYNHFECNGWNEDTKEEIIAVCPKKDKAFKWAERHYKNLIVLEETWLAYFDSKRNCIDLPYEDYIGIRQVKVVGSERKKK